MLLWCSLTPVVKNLFVKAQNDFIIILYFINLLYVYRQEECERLANQQENEITTCINSLKRILTYRKSIGDPQTVSHLGKVFQHLSKVEYYGSKYYGDSTTGEEVAMLNASICISKEPGSKEHYGDAYKRYSYNSVSFFSPALKLFTIIE